jgi:hypothetical protein
MGERSSYPQFLCLNVENVVIDWKFDRALKIYENKITFCLNLYQIKQWQRRESLIAGNA